MAFLLNIKRIPVLLSLFAVVFLAACGAAGRITYDSPQEAFGKGRALFEDGRYELAIPYFQGVFSFGRMHQWAPDAQLYLARSYYNNSEYLLAINEYQRFGQIYRTDDRVVVANFEEAMSYFELSPVPALDQSQTKRAIEEFQLFIDRHPQDTLVAHAQQRIVELRSKLGEKQFMVGELYERRGLFEAAALQYEAVFDLYSDTPWADDGLVAAMRTYIMFADQSILTRQEERLGLASRNYDRMVQIFPDSENMDEAEDYYAQIQDRLANLEAQMNVEPAAAPATDSTQVQ